MSDQDDDVAVTVVAFLVTALALSAVLALTWEVTVRINTPEEVAQGETFTAYLSITYVEDFDAGTVAVTYDPTVLEFVACSDG